MDSKKILALIILIHSSQEYALVEQSINSKILMQYDNTFLGFLNEENIDAITLSLKYVIEEREEARYLLNDDIFTQMLIEDLTMMPHAKGNPIFAAARIGTPSALQWLRKYLRGLKDPAEIKNAEQELVIASGDNDLAVMDMLLAAGVSPNATSVSGMTAIMNAIDRGATPALEKLIKAGASNLNQKFYSLVTPLMRAVEKRNFEAVELLLQAGADPYETDWREDNLFNYTQSYQDECAVSLLIKKYGYHFLHKNNKEPDFSYGIGCCSLGGGPVTKTQEIIDYSNSSSRAKDNLIFAAILKTISPCKRKCNISYYNNLSWLNGYLFNNPMHMELAEQELIIACGNNDLTAIDMLLGAGVTPNASTSGGFTALMNATIRGAYEALEKLINAGVININAQAHYLGGKTALMFALQNGDYKSVEKLIRASASPTIEDYYGANALDYSKRFLCQLVTMYGDEKN